MIDLHTHLLPDWDDGAKTWDDVKKMTEIAYKDGIRKIVLTPHMFRLNGYNDSLAALDVHLTEFYEKTKDLPVVFYKGAEVFIHHEIVRILKEFPLTVNNSSYVFIEFPSDHILPGVKDMFFNLMLEGFVPIISHPERNHVFRERPNLLYDLIQMGGLGQVTAKSLSGGFGSGIRKTALLFLEHNLVHIIASDAHDSERRPPLLSGAVEEARKIVGDRKARAMVTSIPQAILDNAEIGDWGAPINPVNSMKWILKVPNFLKTKKNDSDVQ